MNTAASAHSHDRASPDGDVESDTASGEGPETSATAPVVETELPDTTDGDGTPLENPSGG